VSNPSVFELSSAERLFWQAFWGTTVLKLALALILPFTGDEAYFVFWGRHPGFGYYDHGATTGWLLSAMLKLGDSSWLMRLPAVLVSQGTGWLLWRTLRRLDPAKAAWAAALYLVSPINVFNVLTTTDTPLLLCSIFAVTFVFRGLRGQSSTDWFLAGLCIGLAILSKYLAVLLLSLLVCARGRGLAWMIIGLVPGIAINVGWNATNGWTNILFNLITRNTNAAFSLMPPIKLLIVLSAMAGPAVLWALVPHVGSLRRRWLEIWNDLRRSGTAAFFIALVVPIGILFAVSFFRKVGAHWVVGFFPFLYPVLFVWLRPERLQRLIRPTAIYSAVPVAIACLIPFIPVRWLAEHRSAVTILISLRPADVLAELEPYRSEYVVATPSYSKSSVLAHFMRQPVPVVGHGSFHGRQDDFVTDFRTLDGGQILILTDDAIEIEWSRPWFAHLEVIERELHGVPFYLLLGQGFSYQVYRDQVLLPVAKQYYAMPMWLQRFTIGTGVFLERYQLDRSVPHAR
jgi:hypothetical protein